MRAGAALDISKSVSPACNAGSSRLPKCAALSEPKSAALARSVERQVRAQLSLCCMAENIKVVFLCVLCCQLDEAYTASFPGRFVAKSQSRVARPMSGGQGTGSDIRGGACPAVPQTGTGARKKGASPQQYVEGLNDEPVGLGHVR